MTDTEFERIRHEVLIKGFKNPFTTPNRTLIETGLRFHQENNPESFHAQTVLIMEYRPDDLEAYFQGLLDAGVPQADVDAQRHAGAQA